MIIFKETYNGPLSTPTRTPWTSKRQERAGNTPPIVPISRIDFRLADSWAKYIIMKAILTFVCIYLFFQTVDTKKLEEAFISLKKSDNKETQVNYFRLFPNDFQSFERTFGYTNEKAAPLYNNSYDYITKFYALDMVSKKEKLQKAINIGINGKWDADAVNHFQHYLKPLILSNVDITYQILKEKDAKDVESFFFFLFSGIHPQYKTVPTELNKIKSKDKAFYGFVVKGHQKAIKDSGH
jgi:hypothetical protein